MPWSKFFGGVVTAYPYDQSAGSPAPKLEPIPRIRPMRLGFSFSDRQMEEGLYTIDSVQRFAGFSTVTDPLPSKTTTLRFRYSLGEHELTGALLDTMNGRLEGADLLISKGTKVDTIIIPAPGSTQNAKR